MGLWEILWTTYGAFLQSSHSLAWFNVHAGLSALFPPSLSHFFWQ